MRRLILLFATGFLAGCAPAIAIVDPWGEGPATKPRVVEDFENGPRTYGFANLAAGASVRLSDETLSPHSGQHALRADFDSGTGAWGAGFGVRLRAFDAKPAPSLGLEFWAKGAAGMNFSVVLRQGKSCGASKFQCPDLTTDGGGWQRFFVSFDDFALREDAGSGKGLLNKSCIEIVEFAVDPKQGKGTVWVDDLVWH